MLNLIRIEPSDEWKTEFRIRYGHYEYLVMSFRLANVWATFEDMMKAILQDQINYGVVVNIADILIYTENQDRDVQLTREVLC
jgi:hypothetical protein